MKLKLTFFGLIIFLLGSVTDGKAHTGDKEFYLIDSLDISALSNRDRVLIDSTLTQFHQEEDDTLQLDLLNHIINNCWDDQVWPRYNSYMKSLANNLLSEGHNRSAKWNAKVMNMFALAINNEGYINYYYGNIDGALRYYHESLRLREKTGDSLGISEVYNNIGGIFFSQEEYDDAIDYFKKSLLLKRNIDMPSSVATSLNNIGSIYNITGNLDSAEFYFKQCMAIFEDERDNEGLGLSYHNLASVHAKRHEVDIAHLFFLKSIRTNEMIGEYRMVSNSYALLGQMYLVEGDYEKAEFYGKRALEYANDLGYPDEIKEATEILHELYRKKGDFELALEMHDLYVIMKDSVQNNQIKQDIESQKLTYEFEKKALADSIKHREENRINEHKIAEQDARLKRERAIMFALISGVLFLIIISIIILIALRNNRRANVEIEAQKKEVEKQRDLVQQQHEVTEEQRVMLKVQNKEILDSITYAKRLQEAILPSDSKRNKYLAESFIFYKPKDIVAGDFYWIKSVGDLTYFAVADCTGHGVPGAFVSLVCSNALNNVMLEIGSAHPCEILEKVTEKVIKAFEQNSNQIKDGMDIALCAYNTKTGKLQYAGAYNPLWVINQREDMGVETIQVVNEEGGPILHEIKGTRQPIGKFSVKRPFDGHEIQLEKGDIIYLISDGYADQFGGKSGKKFKYKQLKSLLIGISGYEMSNQHQMLNSAYEKWKGELEQVDDVCIMGIRF